MRFLALRVMLFINHSFFKIRSVKKQIHVLSLFQIIRLVENFTNLSAAEFVKFVCMAPCGISNDRTEFGVVTAVGHQKG